MVETHKYRKAITFLRSLRWSAKLVKAHQNSLSAAWEPLPVDHDKPYIRLLRLKKGKEGLPDCSLFVVRLDSAPPFDALSYCWGTGDDIHPILCNGQSVLVKQNLFAALERLQKTEHTLVWIDALCIQQSNMAEKSHQVALMDRIYQSARKTIIWLGPCDDDEAQLAHYVELLGKAYYRRHRIFPEGMPSVFAYHGVELTKRGLPPWKADHEPLLGPISNLYSQQWFSRTWIIQEFALSATAIFLYGGTFFTIKQLKDVLQILPWLSGWRYYDAVHTMQHFTALTYSRELAQKTARDQFTKKHNALEIMWTHSVSACSDQRDKVYSMLGIFKVSNRESKQEEFNIIPDYTASLEETYTKFASEVLRVTQTLDLLCVLRPSDLPGLPLLPSWVPDFRTTVSYQGLYFDGGGKDGKSACNDVPVWYELQDHKLTLSGFVFDEIIALSCFEPNIHTFIVNETDLLVDNEAALAAVGRILKSRFETCPTTGKYVNGEQAYDAFVAMHFFWQDINGNLYPAPASFEQARQIIRWSEVNPLQKPELDLIDMYGDPLNMNVAYQYWGLDLSLKAARTKQGYYCWVPCGTEIGDSVLLCAGSRTPLVSRQNDMNRGQNHQMLGGCYVQGIMDGEGWDSDLVKPFIFE